MRRTLIGFLGGLSLLGSIVLAPTVAGAAKTPAGCTSSSAGAQVGTGDKNWDGASYQATVSDPGSPPSTLPGGIETSPGTPPTYSGGTFGFALGLNGPSCTNAVYTVYVFKHDDGANNSTATGEGTTFSAAGDGTSNPIDITKGTQYIFPGYSETCVLAHATISVNGALVATSREHDVCGNGGTGRTWG